MVKTMSLVMSSSVKSNQMTSTNGSALKVFDQPDPSQDDNPTLGQSTSLKYYKKAIPFFMPNRLATWNVLNKSGNPTRSQIIIDLIKAVRKKEVRRLGKPSAARHPL